LGRPSTAAPKSDGGLRTCLDYWAINKGTIEDKNPIPRVDEIFDRLQRAKHFTTLDLRSGYHQMKVRKQDIPKTCIRTRYGSFEFLMIPFAVTNSPSVFQTLMSTIFRDLVDVIVMFYLVDILVYRKNPADHKRHVHEVLRRRKQEKLFSKRSNCHLNRQEVKIPRHVVGPGGVAMQSDKVAAIQDWPTRPARSSYRRSSRWRTTIADSSQSSRL
jgi:Reverse transcriptase (RNA-dependent DNA polymerase)